MPGYKGGGRSRSAGASMDRVALTVLVLVQTAPRWCHRLPQPPAPAPLHATLDLPSSAEQLQFIHEGSSTERFSFLPTPNIVTPILSTSLNIQPDQFVHAEPALDLLPQILNPITPIHSDRLRPHALEYWEQRPHRHTRHHKLKVKELYSDNGKLWTKFPNKKHLVEIVPLRAKKGKKKGKALAYILPKSNIKRKLKEQLQLHGLIHSTIPDLSDVFESREKKSYQEDSSDSENSDTFESSSSEYGYHNSNTAQVFHENVIPSIPNNQIIISDDLNPEDVINNKFNDVVSFFNKRHNNEKVNSLVVQDVLPYKNNDSDYHVHYIIHKHDHANDKDHENNTDSQPDEYASNESHESHEIYNIGNEENQAIKLVHQPYLTSSEEVFQDHNYIDPNSNAHLHKGHINLHHKINKDDIDNNFDLDNLYNILKEESDRAKHSPHGINQYEINSHHEPHFVHHNFNPHDLSYENNLFAGLVSRDVENDIFTGDIDNINSSSEKIPLNHIHDIIHGNHLDPDFSNIFETKTQGAYNPKDEIQIILHETNEYVDNTNTNNNIESGQSDSESGSIQMDSVNSDLSGDLSSEASDDSAMDTDDPYFQPESTESNSSSEGDFMSEDLVVSESDEHQTNDENSNSSIENVVSNSMYPYTILNPDDILSTNLYLNNGDDESSPEDFSIKDESTGYLQQPHHYDNNAEIALNDFKEHHFVLPDCLKTKKQKCKKDNANCKGHNFYKLIFLFDRQ